MKLENFMLFSFLVVCSYANAQTSFVQDLLSRGFDQINKKECANANSSYLLYQSLRTGKTQSTEASAQQLYGEINKVKYNKKCARHIQVDDALDDDLEPVSGGIKNEYVKRANDAYNQRLFSTAAEYYFKYMIFNAAHFDQNDNDSNKYYEKINNCFSSRDN